MSPLLSATKKNFYIAAVTVGVSFLILLSCKEHETHFATGLPEEPINTVKRPEDVDVVLPQAGDVALVERYCLPCHSLRYIEMQPRMSHKTWQKVVDKMIAGYGAPVRDSQTAARIVNYLYAIKQLKD